MQQRINWSNPANGQRLLAAILAAQGMKVRSLDLYILGSGLFACYCLFPTSLAFTDLKMLHYKSFVVKGCLQLEGKRFIWL